MSTTRALRRATIYVAVDDPILAIPLADDMWELVKALPGDRSNARVHPGFVKAHEARLGKAETVRALGGVVRECAEQAGGVNVLFDTIGVPPKAVARAAHKFRLRGYKAEEIEAVVRYDAAGVATSVFPEVVAWLLSQGKRAKVREAYAVETVYEKEVPYGLNVAWGADAVYASHQG